VGDGEFYNHTRGAELLVDGESVGTTPLNAEILQGRREVTLKLTGFKAWQERLDLDAGTSLIIPRVELVPADGLVFIKSQPSGASVTIGGEFKGQTPLEVALAPDVNHVITFFKNGYTSKDTPNYTAQTRRASSRSNSPRAVGRHHRGDAKRCRIIYRRREPRQRESNTRAHGD
jgi:hypothetical protein